MIKNYSIIQILLIILTGTVALSVHVFILKYFNRPVVNIDPKLNQIIGFIIRFATVIGGFLIYFLSREYLERFQLFYRVILFAVFIMALTEQLFRLPIMEIVTGVPLAYEVVTTTIPIYVNFLALAVLIILFNVMILKKPQYLFLKYTVVTIITTVVILFIKKLTNYFLQPLIALVPQVDMAKLIYPPYGLKVMVFSYLTFLEPTVACFILFYLIKDKLSVLSTLSKGLFTGGLLILLHGGIYSLVQIVCSEGNIAYRIFYYGQFLWEYLALGILTAYSFVLLDKKIGEKQC